ncbi:FecR family protein [Sulfuricurvum sp.]|uniref:FecR family protein n=1 Tax=Sulfuricurvum sp. TaxID=2025608 RepID=UPI0025CFA04A|nr:FecR family protein [Sulfuricurvum sp.]
MNKKWIVALWVTVSLTISGFGQSEQSKDWLFTQLGMAFKFQQQHDEMDERIRKADAMIAKANELIRRAQETGNNGAEEIASKARMKAQENKEFCEHRKIQIDKNIAYVRNRMVGATGTGAKIGGMVTHYSGRVRVISGKAPYDAVAMDGEHPAYFEEGDTIETYDNSRAEIQFLDGRGSMSIGEFSRVKMEKKDALSETLSLVKGKMYTTVDKAETYQKWVEQKAAEAADNPDAFLSEQFGKIRAEVKKYSRKFEVRTPTAICAVRGTTFSMSADEEGTTTIELIEGEVEISNLKTLVQTSLKGGEKMTLNPDGSIRIEPLVLTSKSWWEKQ